MKCGSGIPFAYLYQEYAPGTRLPGEPARGSVQVVTCLICRVAAAMLQVADDCRRNIWSWMKRRDGYNVDVVSL
jgi:hypothetical protein